MPSFSSNRSLVRAFLFLASALVVTAAAKWLFDHGQIIASLSSAGLALVLCVGAIYLCAPMVARWGRLRGVRLPWNYGLTKEGFFFVLAVLVVAFAALTSGNNLIYLVLSCMLATMVLSGLISRLGLAGLQLQLSFPNRLFARQRSLTRVTLRNLKRGLPSFSIWVGLAPTAGDRRDVAMEEIYCPMISGGGTAVVSVPITFGRRGRYGRGHFRLRSRFPFSFVERRVHLPLTQEVLIYPSTEPSSATESIVERLEQQWTAPGRGDSQDLYRIRPAVPDDGARFVDWKATARSGDVMVREFTREDHGRLDVVFDRAIPEGSEWETRFERAVELCAAVVWRLHSMQAEIRFSSDDCLVLSSPNSAAIYEILRYLAVVAPAAGAERLLEHQAGPTGGRYQLIFTAGEERALPALQSTEGRYVLLGQL